MNGKWKKNVSLLKEPNTPVAWCGSFLSKGISLQQLNESDWSAPFPYNYFLMEMPSPSSSESSQLLNWLEVIQTEY